MLRPRMVSGARALRRGAGRHASDTARARVLRERDFNGARSRSGQAGINPPLRAVRICES
jgi:hypothetical protein